MSLGLEQRLRQLMNAADEEQRAALFLGARRLVDPFQMGSLFKVMAMTSRGMRGPAALRKTGRRSRLNVRTAHAQFPFHGGYRLSAATLSGKMLTTAG